MDQESTALPDFAIMGNWGSCLLPMSPCLVLACALAVAVYGLIFGTSLWRMYPSFKSKVPSTDAPQYYSTAARRAYLVVPEIGVLKWFLELLLNGSVNFKLSGRF